MRYLPLIARILLGLVFFAAGLSALLGMAPPPDNLPERMKTYMAGIEATGYFFKFLKITETICGLLLLSGFFVPLALVILAPIVINIFLTHLFMAPEGLVLAIVIGALEAYLALFARPYSDVIRPLFRPKP